MIDYETYVKIRNLHERDGLKCSQIADELAMDQRTVAKWINEKRYQPRKSTPRKSKLDPFKKDILRMLKNHPYSATQIVQRIRENGFAGGKTIVEDYVRRVRPPKTKAFLKLVFAPGECAQVDWGSFGSVRVGSTTRRLSFFVMVLCHSRLMYLDFADHYGFSIVPCNVGKGNEKGQVENAVGYVKKNLLNGLDIPDFSMMEPAARQWLDTVANVRIHKETGKSCIFRMIPDDSGHRFRLISATHSDGSRPVIPIHFGHPQPNNS
ncbi:MAG: transposase [Dissulfuribacterales bacterium]